MRQLQVRSECGERCGERGVYWSPNSMYTLVPHSERLMLDRTGWPVGRRYFGDEGVWG